MTKRGRRDDVHERIWPPFAMGVLALLRDQENRLVLVKPTYNRRQYYLVGGAVEPGDTDFEETLRREVKEETGLDRVAGRLLVAERTPADPKRNKPAGANLIFDVAPLAPGEWEAIRLPPKELCDIRRVTSERIDDWTLPPLARRIRAAYSALTTGRCQVLGPYQETGESHS